MESTVENVSIEKTNLSAGRFREPWIGEHYFWRSLWTLRIRSPDNGRLDFVKNVVRIQNSPVAATQLGTDGWPIKFELDFEL